MPNRRWLCSLTQQDPTGWYRMTNALQTWYHLWKSNDKHGHRTSESTYSTRNRSMCKHLIAIQNHGRAGWTQLVCQQPVRVEAYWYWVSVHASFFVLKNYITLLVSHILWHIGLYAHCLHTAIFLFRSIETKSSEANSVSSSKHISIDVCI